MGSYSVPSKGVKMKKCTKCGIEKELECFSKRKDAKDGYRGHCKECRRLFKQQFYQDNKEQITVRDKQYRQDNKEQISFKRRQYRLANPEKFTMKNKRYYLKNKERINIHNKQYKLDNKEKIADRNKQYYINNPDKVRTSRRKRRALKLNVSENYTRTDEQLTRESFENQCCNCGSTNNLQIDHFEPLSKGNPLTLLNACVLCRSCNSSKSNKPPEHFFEIEKYWEIKVLMDKADEQKERKL